jgi:hypothetical protein
MSELTGMMYLQVTVIVREHIHGLMYGPITVTSIIKLEQNSRLPISLIKE